MRVSRQIFQGVILNNLTTMVEMGVGFLQQVIMVGYLLGLKQYGSLAFFQAGFGMIAVFFNLNLNYSAIRFAGAASGKEDEEAFYKIQGTTLLLTFALNVLLAVACLGLMLWGFQYHGKVVGQYYLLLAINCIASLGGGFAGQIYTSRKQFKELSIQQIVCAVAGAVGTVGYAYYDRTVMGAIYGMIIGSVLASLLSLAMVRKDLKRCRIDLSMTKSFGIYGGQFALSSVIKQVFWKADVVLLGLFTSEKAVGIYRIAQTVANPLMRVFSPLWTVLFPTVSAESGKGNVDNVKKLLFRGTQWLVLGNLPIVIVGSYLLDFLIPRIYHAADAAIFPIRLLLWGYALGTMTSVSPPILRVYRNDIALYTTLAAAILNIGLNLILIPLFHVQGAAIASFISFGLLALVVFYYAFRCIDIPVVPLLTPPVMLQVALIGLMMISSIMNHVVISLALFAGLTLFLFRNRLVTVNELKTYIAS